MTDIRGITPAIAPQPVEPQGSSAVPRADPPSQPADTVEISSQALMASKIADLPATRADLVARVRAEIQAGTYETPEKLDIAIQRLMEET